MNKPPAQTDFDDLQAIFDQRDRNSRKAGFNPMEVPGASLSGKPSSGSQAVHSGAFRQPEPLQRETSVRYAPPPQPRPAAAPDYNLDAMRRVHETGLSEEAPVPAKPRRPRKKRRGFLRILLSLFGILLVLILLFGFGSVLLAKAPRTDQPIGPRRDGCSVILLCGTDEEGTRTDTMMLLYLDRNKEQIRLLSLPRDTMVNRDNPVPKLNGAYGANGMGEKGMDVLMDYVRDLVGYRPDGYILIDLDCFEELVDQMGGVSFEVPMDMHYEDASQDLYIDLKAGVQHLDGKQAMWLVRYRSGYAMADLERVRVQRSFMTAAMDQWISGAKLFRVPGALSLLLKHTKTDMNYRNLCWIALAIAKCGTGNLESDTLPGTPEMVNGGAYYVEDREAAAALINEKYNPYEKEITADDLHPYGY